MAFIQSLHMQTEKLLHKFDQLNYLNTLAIRTERLRRNLEVIKSNSHAFAN